MANPEHVELLNQGIPVWNQWWLENMPPEPEKGPDLSGLNLSGVKLAGAFLWKTNFQNTLLLGADLRNTELVSANFSGVCLCRTQLDHTDLMSANLRGACLVEASIKYAHLSHVDLTNADLTKANLSGTALQGAHLTGAILNGANLSRALFNDNDLAETDFSNASLFETTLANLDLSGARGLEECIHLGPSSLDFRTLHRSRELSRSFMQGCGLSDRVIEYVPSLTDQPIQLYSCFISFTEADDKFAKKLYDDLWAAGVTCWRWKEDAKWGRNQWGQIDQAIAAHDKVIVVCSKNSLNSGPVIREIERALQLEDKLLSRGEEPEVLFPIQVDDHVFQWEHPRKADVIAKTVGDFRDWENPDHYEKSFNRLVQDLSK